MTDMDMNAAAFPFKKALRCSCPKCGKGRLFKGLLSLGYLKECASCALDYKRFDAGDGPAVMIMMLLGFVVMIAAVVVEFKYEPPFWVHVALWLPTTYLATVGMLKVGKSLMAAADYTYNAGIGVLDSSQDSSSQILDE